MAAMHGRYMLGLQKLKFLNNSIHGGFQTPRTRRKIAAEIISIT
jgi:hypothetical protein